MIGHIDFDKLNKSEKIKIQNRQDESILNSSVPILQEDIIQQVKNSMAEKGPKSLNRRRKLFEDYDGKVSAYKREQSQNRGDGPKEPLEGGISVDEAREYLLNVGEIDISSDEALIDNYVRLMEADKMITRMQSVSETLNSSLVEPEVTSRFRQLSLITEYAKARFQVFDNILFTELDAADLESIEEAEDLDVALGLPLSFKKGDRILTPQDLMALYNGMKRSKELLTQIQNGDFGQQNDPVVINDNVRQEENNAHQNEHLNEHVNEHQNEHQNGHVNEHQNELQNEHQNELQNDHDNEQHLEDARENRFKQQRLESDRAYVIQHFPYSDLLNSKRKGNKADGAEMQAIKSAIGELKNAATTEAKTFAQLNEIYARLIGSLREYVRTHDVFYKAISGEGAERLALVKDALLRARLERKQLWKLHSHDEQDGSEFESNKKVSLEENGDSTVFYANMTRGLDITLAVDKKITQTFVTGKDKDKHKKEKLSALSKLFYRADILGEEDKDKYALLTGKGGMAQALLHNLTDNDMIKDFYVERDRMLMKLIARYNGYKRHPVPAAFLRDQNADPRDESAREQYAMLCVMQDDAYRQLVGLGKIEEILGEDHLEELYDNEVARKENYKPGEKQLLEKGTQLFNRLKGIAGNDPANDAFQLSLLNPAQVALKRFTEVNEVKKSMKEYGLTDDQVGVESENLLTEEFTLMNPQYADVRRYDPAQGAVMEKEVQMKKGEERTNRRFAKAGIEPGRPMKMRSALTGVMADLLGMGGLVSQDVHGEITEGDKKVRVLYKEAPKGEQLMNLPAHQLSTDVKAQMAKLVFLNMLCGQMNLDSAMLSAEVGMYDQQMQTYFIKKIRLDKYTEYSFGNLKGNDILEAYKNGRHKELLGMLDDETKNAIMSLSPIFIEQNFGMYLSKDEMLALKDRIRTVQLFLSESARQENVQKDKDIYKPKKEYISPHEELTYDRVKEYMALPEKEKEKRRAENIANNTTNGEFSNIVSRRFRKNFNERIRKETGLTDDQITEILHKPIKCGKFKVTTNALDGNRFGGSLASFLSQDMVTDEDFYRIMKGLYGEYFAEYNHQNKEMVKEDFDLAVSKVKDLMLKRFGRLIEKLGELPALMNPEDLFVMVDGGELTCLLMYLQDLHQLVSETEGGSLFNKDDPRDAKLLALREYADALNAILSAYSGQNFMFGQDQDVSEKAFDEEKKANPQDSPDIADVVEMVRPYIKKLADAARKLGKGPALTKEEYDAYIADCEKRFENRPLAKAYLKVQTEELKEHIFVKKEKPAQEDDSDYIARIEEYRKKGNNIITVEGLKFHDKLLADSAGRQRIVNEFFAAHNIKLDDARGAFDLRSVPLYIENYERDENGDPADGHARMIMERNNDFLEALFTGDRERMRPHMDRVVSQLLSLDITPEHLIDKDWLIKHPELFFFSSSFGYMEDDAKNKEEYTWYFDELDPVIYSLVISKMEYVTAISTEINSNALGPALGFKMNSSTHKIWTGRDAENNCVSWEEGIEVSNEAFDDIDVFGKKTKEEKKRKKNGAAGGAPAVQGEQVVVGDEEIIIPADRNRFIEYEMIKNRPKSPEAKAAIKYINHIRKESRRPYLSDDNRGAYLRRLDAFYQKYATQLSKKEKAPVPGSVIRLVDRKLADDLTGDTIGEVLEQNWSELFKEGSKTVSSVKTGSMKERMGNAKSRSDDRLSLILTEEENRESFKEALEKLPRELMFKPEEELETFYSLFCFNLTILNKEAASANLAYVIKSFYGNETEKKTALDVVTQNILSMAGDKSAFVEKNLSGNTGIAMANMSANYVTMLEKNPEYVAFLKSKTDEKTGRTYFSLVSEAMDVIRAAGAYVRLYNTLKKDPVFASSDRAFLLAPVSASDTYEVRRAKSAMVKLNDMAEKLQRGEYKKTDIDNFELIKSEEREISDICSKFNEAAGSDYEAYNDIKNVLSGKIGSIEDTDKKVLELTRLLSSLDTMESELEWTRDPELLEGFETIINENPLEIMNASVKLRNKLLNDLDEEYRNFMEGEVPEFLADPGYAGDKTEQKKSAAYLMLTTTTTFRRLRGVEKLLELFPQDMTVPENVSEAAEIYQEADFRVFNGESYQGLSKKGILEVRDKAKRVNLRTSKAILSKYTSPENAGYTERSPITEEEINGWIQDLPHQEERARANPNIPLDPEVLNEARRLLPGIHEDYSDKLTAEHVAVMEKVKNSSDKNAAVWEAFYNKWVKGRKLNDSLDVRSYDCYRAYEDGCSLEVLLSDEPEAREYYLDQYVRKAMNLEISWDNLNMEWIMSHYDDVNYIMHIGTSFRILQEDNPEYFEAMPKKLFDLLEAKIYMISCFTNALTMELSKQDIVLSDNRYLKEEEGSGDAQFCERKDQDIAFQKQEYEETREKMLGLCNNNAA
jgi:hypothetical protein